MLQKIMLAAFCGIAMCAQSFAQSTLTQERNGLLEGEHSRQGIEFFNAGAGGDDLLWEYPIDKLDDSKCTLLIQNDTVKATRRACVSVSDDQETRRYSLFGDTLMLCNTESPLQQTWYVKPLLRMHYPLEYGDTISRPFKGYGKYCGDHYFKEQGLSTVISDATGSLVVGENDTIHNVLRVYTLKSYSLCMDLNAAALDTASLRQVIEERYEWYASGCRYPVLETITSTSYHNLNALGTTRKAWCCLPSEQLMLNDSVNREVQRQDSIALAEKELAEKDIIHYTVSVSNGRVTLGYSLDADAHIVTMLADVFGMVYRRSDWTQVQGVGYSRDTDCTGLRRGTYIFYINVNGRIYSEKVSL